MNLHEAQKITDKGMGVPRSTWNDAQQTALFLLGQGEGRPTGELVDWDEREDPRRDEEADDFTVDDVSGWISGAC